MIPEHNDKLTRQLLSASIPEWDNPGFTDALMQKVIALERRKSRRRLLLFVSVAIGVISLLVYALVNLVRLQPSTFSREVNGLGQLGTWLTDNGYILLPLVLLLLTKTLIDSLRSRATMQHSG